MVGPCLAGSVDWELDADDCCTLWSNPRRGANEVSPSRGFGARPPPPVPVAPRMPPSRGFRTRSSARRSANEALLFVAPRRLASRGSTAWPPPSELASPRRALGSRTGSVLWPNPSSPSLPGRRTGTPRCSNPFSPEFSLGWLPLAFSSFSELHFSLFIASFRPLPLHLGSPHALMQLIQGDFGTVLGLTLEVEALSALLLPSTSTAPRSWFQPRSECRSTSSCRVLFRLLLLLRLAPGLLAGSQPGW